MHLNGNASFLQRKVVNQRVIYRIDRIVLRLQQKRRRCLASDRNIRIQLKIFRSVLQHVPRIKGHGKVRTTAFFVGCIENGIQALLEIRADRRHEVPACGKAEHSDFVRIDVPLRGVEPHQPHGSLRIFQSHWRFWIRARSRRQVLAGYAIFQQHTRNPLGRQPVADLCALEIDR